jgi:hypothetical protein
MATSLSRSGSTSPLGKLSYETKVRVAESVGEELERQARELGLGVGEYIREVLTIKALGYEHVRRLYQDRLEMVAGSGTESAHK